MNNIQKIARMFDQISAEKEQDLLIHQGALVDNAAFSEGLRIGGSVFVGRKGDGKTALRFGLDTRERDGRFVDDVSFVDLAAPLFFRLVDQCDQQCHVGRAHLLKKMWRFFVGTRLIHNVVGAGRLSPYWNDQDIGPHLQTCKDYLGSLKFVGTPGGGATSLVDIAQHCAESVGPYLKENTSRAAVQEFFPTTPNFLRAEAALFQILRRVDGATLILDDLDPWLETIAFEKVSSFVQSVVAAAHEIEVEVPSSVLRLRLFVPQSAFLETRFYHEDKEAHGAAWVRWSSVELEQLVSRRIAVALNVRGGGRWSENVQHLLERVFDPQMRIRDIWQVDRSPFQYILMYSQYNPRDIIFAFHKMCEHATSNGQDPDRFSDQDIRDGVREAAYKGAERIAREYGIRLPHCVKLFTAFSKMGAEMSYGEALHRLCQLDSELLSGLEVQRVIELLYDMGFFGKIVLRPPDGRPEIAPREERQVYYAYVRPRPDFCENDALVVHPMFWERFQIIPPRMRLPALGKPVD